MPITSIEAFREDLELISPYSISQSTQREANYVLVLVRDDRGNIGLGEASPLPGYSKETQESVLDVIHRLAAVLIGVNEFAISNILELMDSEIEGSLEAKSAIEIAIFDLVSKKQNLSLISYLGGPIRSSVRVAGSVGFDSSLAVSQRAQELVQLGFLTLKVKIGQSIDKDVELVSNVRKAVGKEVRIRLDANQAYDSDHAIDYLRRLEKFEPELFEQPVNSRDIEGMSKITKTIDTPIVADEPIVTAKDLLRFAQADAMDYVKLKVNKCGGIRKTLLISELARTLDIKVILGSGHESSIGVAAESSVALSSKNIDPVGEMNGNLRLKSEYVRYRLLPKRDMIEVWSKPGLGLELNPDVLNQWL